MRGISRSGFERVDQDSFNNVVGDRAGCSWPVGVDETVKASFEEPVPPFRRGVGVTANFGGDRRVGEPVACAENDL